MTPARSIELDPKNHIASIVKAIDVLEAFKGDRAELSLAELMTKCGHSRTTMYRILNTLEVAGWVERTRSADYRLTLRVFELASAVLGSFDLRTEASHVMSELAARFDEHVYLLVPDGARAVCLDMIESSQPIRVMVLSVGRSLPLYLGGAPVALLAELEETALPQVLESRPMLTPAGDEITEEELRATLAETRRRGYSISVGDVTPGVAALGACIRDRKGNVVAALSIGGLSADLSDERQDEMAAALVDGALTVSRRLGYAG
ncbi:IclR family transcriptional regulator [Gordonia terrae]|uniref:IclR family transcriptional regulator n=2 Tax=Gordonia terrae TaxID=2055 RepID=A0AAD0KAA8_9ACTN|nr:MULTISPECIES: IclR family transcriptional regulator [Gordonia]VTR07651.1 transcriptional regulator, IclR family [Clostridioides difficile]ANY23895.1 IclR family transcriptional regulator [Gordonia terrae]AWO84630.1 IclR family transcriptional regulator [Gordonia terrae]VTS55664.1 Transcriptional regulator kdgR [Gordonia terrae]GAB43082.1 putative IclR family transcriptional regulator [Gordonia terrae NBRC 100016]